MNKCFVIMPFDKVQTKLYNEIFEPTIKAVGLDPIRSDEVFNSRAIIDDIFNQIMNARVILADTTKQNPNVIYELGVANAFKKPVIIISDNIKNIPFDLKHLRIIIYDKKKIEWKETLTQKITDRLNSAISSPKENIAWNGIAPYYSELYMQYQQNIYNSLEGVFSKSSKIFCDEIGHCKIIQEWTIKCKTDFPILFHTLHIDKPGKIEILNVIDVLNNDRLNILIKEHTPTELKYFILLNNLKKAKSEFKIRIEAYLENYLADLIETGVGITRHRTNQKAQIKFARKIEEYIFPANEKFKKIKATITNGPKQTNGVLVKTLKSKKDMRIIVDFNSSKHPTRNEYAVEFKM